MAEYLISGSDYVGPGLDNNKEGILRSPAPVDLGGDDYPGCIAYIIDIQCLECSNITSSRSGKADRGIVVRPPINRIAGRGVYTATAADEIDCSSTCRVAKGLVLGSGNGGSWIDRIVAIITIQKISHIIYWCDWIANNLDLRRVPKTIAIDIFVVGIEIVGI